MCVCAWVNSLLLNGFCAQHLGTTKGFGDILANGYVKFWDKVSILSSEAPCFKSFLRGSYLPIPMPPWKAACIRATWHWRPPGHSEPNVGYKFTGLFVERYGVPGIYDRLIQSKKWFWHWYINLKHKRNGNTYVLASFSQCKKIEGNVYKAWSLEENQKHFLAGEGKMNSWIWFQNS